jgi:hypothetical protein
MLEQKRAEAEAREQRADETVEKKTLTEAGSASLGSCR